MSHSKLSRSPDALLPAEMARKSEEIGEKKANLDSISTFVLAILAGAFIGLGAVFYTVVVTTGEVELAYGIKKLAGGMAFSLGLILVIVGGAELFTGNNLIVMAWASGRVSTKKVLRNWTIVFVGNFVGAIGIALLVCFAGVPDQANGAVGETMLSIATHKCQLKWSVAFVAGIGCNVLVCLAVWLCLSARSVADKTLAILFPITAFVAIGMEHCVANMFFVPVAVLHASTSEGVTSISLAEFFVNNLIPVTLGNIVGGSVLVGMIYWFVYLRNENKQNQNGN